MEHATKNRTARRVGVIGVIAAAFVLGSTITVLAQDGPEETSDEPEVTTERATLEDLTDEQVTELGGPEAAEEALKTQNQTQGLDGTFESSRGVYSPRDSQCVLFDTRDGAKLAPGSTTTFSLSGANNVGGESNCTVPSSAVAAHVNLVAIGPNSTGNLKIYGASLTTEPNGGIVNFQALNPNLNNSNAFVTKYDSAGWKVKVNGGGVHVRAIVMGYFYDGGNSYAAVNHDHGIKDATGQAYPVSDTKTIRSLDTTFDDECGLFFHEKHQALVTWSGKVDGRSNTGVTDIRMSSWVDGVNQGSSSSLSVRFPNTDPSTVMPVSRTFLVEGLSSGSHTFEVKAENEDVAGAPFVRADLVVEHRGWDCEFIAP